MKKQTKSKTKINTANLPFSLQADDLFVKWAEGQKAIIQDAEEIRAECKLEIAALLIKHKIQLNYLYQTLDANETVILKQAAVIRKLLVENEVLRQLDEERKLAE